MWGAQQISNCDSILATMEEMLGKFQGDLGNISSEIRALLYLHLLHVVCSQS